MGNKTLMGIFDRFEHPNHKLNPACKRQLMRCAEFFERRSFDVIHDEIGRAAVIDSAINQLNNIWVLERREGALLGMKTRRHRRIIEIFAKQFYRGLLFEIVITLTQIHGAHSALCNWAHKSEPAE